MSLYHDYLRDASNSNVKADRRKGAIVKPLPKPDPSAVPATPCFEDIAVPAWRRHIDGDFGTYLRHALRHLRGERHPNDVAKVQDWELHELALKDIVAASIKICMLEIEADKPKSIALNVNFNAGVAENALITLLIACAESGSTMATVRALDSILERLAGFSALATPLLLQVLVAVAFSHHNNALVLELVALSPPPRRNLFNLQPRRSDRPCGTWLWSHWLHSAKPLGVWAALLRAEWVAPCGDMMEFVYRARDAPSEAAHAIYIFDRVRTSKGGLPMDVLSTIEQTVSMGPPAVVSHMLATLPHRGIRPRPHFLLTDAARKTRVDRARGMVPLGAEMLEVLRPMGLDINSIIDPRGKAEGVSPLERTPLHAATSQGNVATVRWCLQNGARPVKDWYGKYQWERVKDQNRKEILELYKAEGWDIDDKAWLLKCERKEADRSLLRRLRRIVRTLC
ncbi:hypothetical protein GGR51DRAFT_496006 [Nemania sp. FL0031]|nr:hypothetical protein GGR51DRAFT_496006 [Nemania sp. FL0031]